MPDFYCTPLKRNDPQLFTKDSRTVDTTVCSAENESRKRTKPRTALSFRSTCACLPTSLSLTLMALGTSCSTSRIIARMQGSRQG